MDENKHNYENNIIFRLIKVLYVLGFIFIGFLILFVAWTEIPYETIDNEKSYLVCKNGNKYTFSKAEVYLSIDESMFDQNNDEDARKVCAYNIINDYTDKYSIPKEINYELSLANKTNGSWQLVFGITVFGISIAFIVLNLIRETLLYVLLGKPFSLTWLRQILDS